MSRIFRLSILFLASILGFTSEKAWGNVVGDTLTVVAFGNSITAERATVDQVFAQWIPDLLLEKGIKAKVINSGIRGSHTGSIKDHDLHKVKHGRDRFKSDVLSYHPDLVIIGFGTNDSYIDSKTKGGRSRIPLDKYKVNLEYFIEELKAINADIILMVPNLLGENYPDFQNRRLLKYVKTVRKLSRKYGTGLADNFRMFQEYEEKNKGASVDDLLLDGCHPNDKGHKLIAEALTKEILKVAKK